MNLILFAIIFLVLATATYGALSAAPWLPTKGKDIGRMMDLAQVHKGDVVYDLGCGDGRLVFAAAKRGAESIGVEVFVVPYLVAKIRSLFTARAKIVFGDLFKINISKASVVFVFLLEKSYQRLVNKFERELKPGTRVVVHCWEIKEWRDKLVKEHRTKKDLPIYVYKF